MLLCHVVQEHEVSHGPPRESFTDPFGNSNHCTLFPQKGNLFCSVSTMASFLSVFIIVVLGICSEVLFAEKSRKELRDEEVKGDGIIQLGHPVRSNRFDPSRVIQLSWQPRVFLYRDFLLAEETDHLISLMHGKSNSSSIDNASVDAVKFPTMGIPLDAKDPTSSRIEERISAWTFLPKGNSKPLHVLYSGRESLKGNYSYFERDFALKSNEPLIATVILYLSNVTQGGQILFPESENKILSDCTKSSDALRPTKGDAIVFFNVHLDASPDKSSSHARCPVIDGELWYAIKFFYLRSITEQKDPLQSDFDTSCTDEDENCVRWAATGECERNPVFMASTQWDDIQRKLGNLPPKAPVFKPDPFTPGEDEGSKSKDKDWIDEKTQEELDDLEDDPDLNDDRFLQEYRKKRMAEMREAAKIVRFGSVIPISGSDFVREVSQAPEDIWVVVLLYKDGYSSCQILLQFLDELATKYPVTKFVKIISTDCIPNYPDCNLPTVLVYHNGALKSNYVGLHSFGRRCTPEGVALTLCQSDPVLNDGRSKQGQSREAVLDGVRRRFLEKVVAQHEDDDGSSSD